MSSIIGLSSATPNVKANSAPVVQSVNDLTSEPDLAQTLNQNICDITSDANHHNISEDMSELQNSDTNGGQVMSQSEHREEGKRRKTRRSRKRKRQRLEWRHKRLQWSESTEQEVRRLHKKVVEKGHPLAPYNTTQFIMNEHKCDQEIDFESIHGRVKRMKPSNEDNNQTTNDNNNEEDFYSSPEDESEYLQQQFHEAYDNIHTERLSAMTKTELVEEYLQLEDRIEALERRLKESTEQTIDDNEDNDNSDRTLRRTSNSEVQTEQSSDGQNSVGTEMDEHFDKRTHLFKEEIRKLSEENERLRGDNQRLERIVNERHTSSATSPLDNQ